MKIFSLFLTLLLVSCNPTGNTKPSNRGVGVVDITDTNGSTVLSYKLSRGEFVFEVGGKINGKQSLSRSFKRW